MLIHSAAPLAFWAEALATATYLINWRPCRATASATPYSLLFGVPPAYDELRVFGCRCYPNMISTPAHKLAARSTTCVFIGYPADHRGYRCYNITTGRVITSRHVVFDEDVFPFRDLDLREPASSSSSPPTLPEDDAPQRLVTELPHHPTRARTVRSGGASEQSAATPTSTTAQPVPAPAPTASPTTSPTTSSPIAPSRPPVTTGHPMGTQARDRIHKPNPKYALAATGMLSPMPRSVRSALKDDNWYTAMKAEYDAL